MAWLGRVLGWGPYAASRRRASRRGRGRPRWNQRGARAEAELRYGLRLEGGGEYDSNPARQEQVEGSAAPADVTAATALRLVSALDLALLTGGGHLLSVAVEGAGKRFLDPVVQDEDLLVVDGRFAADFALGERNRLALQLAHYDAFQRASVLPEARDFRSTAPSLRFEHRRDRARFSGGAGWRWFVFKPERSYDFQAPTAFLSYWQSMSPPLEEPGAEWDWRLTASFEGRRFRSRRCVHGCRLSAHGPRRSPHGPLLRRDRRGQPHGGCWWAPVWPGSSTIRTATARAWCAWPPTCGGVLLLPWELSLAARAELVATRYADAVQVGHDPAGTFLSIEDEGRTTLRLELVRPLGPSLEAGRATPSGPPPSAPDRQLPAPHPAGLRRPAAGPVTRTSRGATGWPGSDMIRGRWSAAAEVVADAEVEADVLIDGAAGHPLAVIGAGGEGEGDAAEVEARPEVEALDEAERDDGAGEQLAADGVAPEVLRRSRMSPAPRMCR